jgi:hypothetical protein
LRRGNADRSADLLARVEEARGDSRLGFGHPGERADRHRHEGERESDSAEDEGWEQIPEVVAVNGVHSISQIFGDVFTAQRLSAWERAAQERPSPSLRAA